MTMLPCFSYGTLSWPMFNLLYIYQRPGLYLTTSRSSLIAAFLPNIVDNRDIWYENCYHGVLIGSSCFRSSIHRSCCKANDYWDPVTGAISTAGTMNTIAKYVLSAGLTKCKYSATVPSVPNYSFELMPVLAIVLWRDLIMGPGHIIDGSG